MKIPIYTEVSFEDCNQLNLNDIKKVLEKAQVGLTPSYIATQQLDLTDLLTFLKLLGQAIDELNLSERFPYPLYIITDHLSTHPRFFMAKSVEALPLHYFKKAKRLKPKEQLLLSKVVFTGEKINNVDLPAKLIFLRRQAVLNRELATLCHELASYETILEQLQKASE
ncbi:MAG TPA: hypothetical protein DCY86_15380 [Bdellovibrionales bacterium]|nr:hypothetical protein [Bdellovibrionales bacterium]